MNLSTVTHTVIFSLLSLTLVPSAYCQDDTADNDRKLTTGDGWPIQISYFPSTRGKEAPCVILVPGCEGYEKSRTRKAWSELAGFLQKNGYAVVTVDLRKHGDSVPLGDDGKTHSSGAETAASRLSDDGRSGLRDS